MLEFNELAQMFEKINYHKFIAFYKSIVRYIIHFYKLNIFESILTIAMAIKYYRIVSNLQCHNLIILFPTALGTGKIRQDCK